MYSRHNLLKGVVFDIPNNVASTIGFIMLPNRMLLKPFALATLFYVDRKIEYLVGNIVRPTPSTILY